MENEWEWDQLSQGLANYSWSACFCTHCKLRMGFAFLNGQKKKSKEE